MAYQFPSNLSQLWGIYFIVGNKKSRRFIVKRRVAYTHATHTRTHAHIAPHIATTNKSALSFALAMESQRS